jgi:Lrp/AsnC family leucine-responsive transcriptional regulator
MTVLTIDQTDRKILSLLAENPELSQSEIGHLLKISQPAVGARIHKLRKQGVIAHQIGVNLKKANLGIAKIDLSTNNSAKILEIFEKCPLFLNGFVTSGKHNLCLFLVIEDLASLDACMDCHIRGNPLVSDVELSVVVSSARDLISPLKLIRSKTEASSCGEQCDKCYYYKSERCLGCPNTIHYKGALFG